MQRIISNSIRPRFLRKRRLSCLPSAFPRIPSTFQNPTISTLSFASQRIGDGRFSFSRFSTQVEDISNDTSVEEASDRISFRNHLNNFYRATHDVSLKDAFHTEKIESGSSNPSTLWTSTFECPVSGDRIHAGELPGDEFRVEKDGRWYYSSKKTSLKAAAMQALTQVSEVPSSEEHRTGEQRSKEARSITTKQQLITWYKRKHKISLEDNMFQARKRSVTGKKIGGIWWTASFICPASGQEFKAIELQSGEALYHDSEGYWYRKKSDAINAAAAHAIYINKLEGSDTLPEDKFEAFEEGRGEEEESFLSESGDTNLAGPSAPTRAPLNAHYQKEHNVTISNIDFVASLVSFKGKTVGGNWWTATFICPVTGDRHDSKRLVDSKCHQDSDGIVWYKKKEDSMRAAGLGALDTMRFKKAGVIEPRYCKEDPSEIASEDDTLLLPDLVNEKEASLQKKETPEAISSLGGDGEDAEEEEEYTIELVPQRLGSIEDLGPATTTTTFDLIADTWLESSNLQKSGNSASPLFHNPYLERQEAIDRAHSWVASQKQDHFGDDEGNRTCFNGQGQTTNVKIANLMLDSLARTNRGLPLDNQRSGVEAAATAILEYMWSSQSKPDANSYASFLKCLEGDSPSNLSKTAQRIYDAMSDGTEYDGRILPRPNIAVYNSLIQRLAKAGVETSVQDIDSNMVPNKETFLSILSSMSKPPNHNRNSGIFDADKALSCIDHMKSLSEKYDRSTLSPDIQTYNAPLCWIGGIPSTSSRPYSWCMPWDSYEKIFQKGFKVLLTDNPLIQEASNIENWYYSMKSGKFGSNIHPDIETVESLIQAWVRTATRDGLEKAEALAESLIDDKSGGCKVRVQTFHPILAAWAHSGAHDGPEKVDYWIKRLNDSGLPVMGDGRYRAAPIVARLSSQRQLHREHEVHELASQSATDFHALAVETARRLDGMIQDFESSDDFFIEANTFKLALQAWCNVGQACSRMGDLNGAVEALSSIQDIIRMFDNLIECLYNSDSEGSLNQLLHLLNSSPQIYSAAFSAVKDFDQKLAARVSEKRDVSHLMNHLSSLEQSIRRSEEFRLCTEELQAKARAFSPEQPVDNTGYRGVYKDLFSLSSEAFVQDNLSVTWSGFYIDIIQALEASKIVPEKENDVARIAVLVSDISKMQKAENTPLLNEHIMKILRKFQLNSGEQGVLFNAALQTVYGPPQKRNERSSYSTKSKSNKRPSVAHEKADSSSSSKTGLRRRRNVRNRTTHQRNVSPQHDIVQKKQQAC
jgi:hypothetical protein